MRHGRSEAGQIKDCAAAYQVSTRAVRAWRASNDPRWLKWRTKVAEGAVQMALGGLGVENGTGPEAELAACERRFAAIQRVCDGYAERGDSNALVVSLRAAESAQRMLHEAREHARRRAEADGSVLEQRVVVAAFAAWQRPITEMLQALPAQLAAGCPQEMAVIVEETSQRIIAEEMRKVSREALANMKEIVGDVGGAA